MTTLRPVRCASPPVGCCQPLQRCACFLLHLFFSPDRLLRAVSPMTLFSSLDRRSANQVVPTIFANATHGRAELRANRAPLTRSGLADATLVNRRVNRAIRSVADRQQYGMTEFWALPTAGAGDCEDFALAKKHELVKRGFPANRLLLATVHSRRTGAHAVLILRLENGDYVLDSLHNDIRPWRSTGYTFLRVQSPSSPGTWHAAFTNTP